jgi:hypothetical protein
MLKVYENEHKSCPEINDDTLGAGETGFARVNAPTVAFYRLAHMGFLGMDNSATLGLIANGAHPGLFPKLNSAQRRVAISFQSTHCLQRSTMQKHQKYYMFMLAALHAKDGDKDKFSQVSDCTSFSTDTYVHIIAHVRLGMAGALLRWQLRCGNLPLREPVESERRFH